MCTIPFKTRGQLAAECGVHPRTVSRKLKRLAPQLPPRQLLAPSYQKLFYLNYGWPSDVDRQEYASVMLPPPQTSPK